jgi:hypothetical protein
MDKDTRKNETNSLYEQDPPTKNGEEVKENVLDPKPSAKDNNHVPIYFENSSPINSESDQKKNVHDRFNFRENKKTKKGNHNTPYCEYGKISYFQQQENLLFSMRMKYQKNKEKLSSLKLTKYALILLLFFLTIYFFISFALLIGNFNSQEVIEANYKLPFHLLDLWGSFAFAVIETTLLMVASMLQFGNFRFFIALINIGLTLIAAILYSFNPDYWETSAHWVEYIAQVFLSISDFLFITYQFKNRQNVFYKYRHSEFVFVSLIVGASILKLLVFGSVVLFGESPEHTAHYFEFVGEMANSLFVSVFTKILLEDCEESIKKMENYEKAEDLADTKLVDIRGSV